MPNYGTAFDSEGKYAPGTSHDAGIRRFANKFNAPGGSAEALQVARIREQNVVRGGEVTASVNLSAINFTLGTADDPDKYAAAFAGPTAGGTVRIPILPGVKLEPTAVAETLLLTPSGNVAAGTVIAEVETSKM